MFKKRTLVAMIFALLFMMTGPANAGQEGMTTGDVMVFKNDAWLHWFSFVAQEMGDEPFGTGFINHQRLNNDGTLRREEQSQIRYVIAEFNEAWFTGPIVYDSIDTEPTLWLVVYVQDNGQPGNGNDLIWFDRVDNENDALNLLGSFSWGSYPPDDIESGDIKVYSEPIYVPSDYLTIQSALDAAVSGDAILVNPGTYPENINFNGKDIFLQSTNGADSTIIAPPSGGTVVTIGPNGEILGFTIRNGSEYFGAGMSVSGSGSHIVQNIFESNHQMGGGYGAAIGGNSASPLIERNIFRGNDCDTQWLSGVVSFINSSSPRIVNKICTDPYNADTDDDGIMDGDEDCDGDRFTNLEEVKCGSDPGDPNSRCSISLPFLMLLLD